MARRPQLKLVALSGAVALGWLASDLPLFAQALPARTTSTSGQFSVFGETAPRRLALARRADEIREGWLAATGLPTNWKWPIIIELTRKSAPGRGAPVVSLFLGDADTLKVQVTASADADSESLELAILRALALEFAFRSARPREGKAFSMPPSWLVEAVWQELSMRSEGLPPGLFSKLVEAGPPPKLEVFLRQRPEFMKPTARAIYRAQALGLLGALLASSDGRAGLQRYLENLPVSKPDDAKALLAAFPSLQKDTGQLARLWTLALAKASSSGRGEALASAETSRRLREILQGIKAPADLKLPQGAPAGGVDLMPLLATQPSGRFALARAAEQLQALELRAHPLWIPVVAEFRTVALELSQKPRRDASRRLAAASELAEALEERMQGIADHLNWFEASRETLPSRAFDPPPQLPAVPERLDPVSIAVTAAAKSR